MSHQRERNVTNALAAAFVLAGAMGLAGCDGDRMAKGSTTTTTTSSTTTPVTNGVTTPANDVAAQSYTAPDGSIRTAAPLAPDDAATAEKVKTAMLADPEVKDQAVIIVAQAGVVTLSGTVQTQAQADKLALIAINAEGVKSVTNNLVPRG